MFRPLAHRFPVVPWLLTVLVAAALCAGWPAPASGAGKLEQLDASLRLVPDDAAFYSAMLRNREQVEIVLKSRAWVKAMQMPVVQMGLQMFQAEAANPGSPAAEAMAVLRDPEKLKSLSLLADLASHEIFLYGDKSVVDSLELFQIMAGGTRFGPMMAQLSGAAGDLSPDELQAAMLFRVLADNLDKIKVPDLVIGFKVTQKEQAAEHLQMLEGVAAMALGGNEQLKDRFKKTRVGDHEYLTLTLDGTMIPWDEVPVGRLRETELNEGDVDKVMARLKKLTLTVTFGLRGDYLVLAVGSSTECVAKLGGGKSLATRKEFAPLEKFAEKRLTSLAYVSESFATQLGSSDKDIDGLVEFAEQMLPAAGLGEEKEKRILKDAKALADDLKRAFPKPGAAMGFTFLTARGTEGYAYDWGGHPELDGSKPLGLLNHLGGSPIMAYVSRGRVDAGAYEGLVKWIKVGYGYFEEFALPEMDDDDREQFRAFTKQAMPILKRADAATRRLLVPALADGQLALVLDAKFTSRQFHEAMPPMPRPMPMIEPAVVLGTSDAKALAKAMDEYREVFNAFWALAREMEPGGIPPFEVPPPESEKIKGGTVYFYRLPEELGLDAKIVPNAGLSKTVAVVTASKGHSQRLLTPTPLAAGGVLEGADQRALASAVIFDWAGLVRAATPWVDFAAEMIVREQMPDPEMGKMVLEQVRTALEVLQCLKGYTSESYFEEGALVTHSLTEFQDVK